MGLIPYLQKGHSSLLDGYAGQEWCKFLNKYTLYYYVDTSAL